MYSAGYVEPVIAMVSTFGPWGHDLGLKALSSVPTSTSGTGTNVAKFQPVHVPTCCVARRVWWANGATAAGNVSVSIYACTPDGEPGTKIVECAATAQGTINEVQFADITSTVLPPGTYWLALATSSSSARIMGTSRGDSSTDAQQSFTQSSITVGSMPATATPSEVSGVTLLVFGFATTASP